MDSLKKSRVKKPQLKKKIGGQSNYKALLHTNQPDNKPEFSVQNDDNILTKAVKYVSKNILYPVFVKPLVNKTRNQYNRNQEKMRGGKREIDMTPQEKQILQEARLANSAWAKSKKGKEKIAELQDPNLTNAEKIAVAKQIGRQWKKDVYEPKIARFEEEYQTKLERQKQEASRQQLGEEVEFQKAERIRLAEEAKKKKGDIWGDIANVAIGELVNVLPVPKIAKDIIKTGAKEAYSATSKALKGGAEQTKGAEPLKIRVGLSLNRTRRQPLLNQHPELEDNRLFDEMLTRHVFNHANSLVKNNMRQELAYPPTNLNFTGEGKKTGQKKFIK